jgi:hypothetical protein
MTRRLIRPSTSAAPIRPTLRLVEPSPVHPLRDRARRDHARALRRDRAMAARRGVWAAAAGLVGVAFAWTWAAGAAGDMPAMARAMLAGLVAGALGIAADCLIRLWARLP